MKKVLYNIAQKMEPGIIQNLILRISSKTPKMFRVIQIYSAVTASLLGSLVLGMQTHQMPDFKYEGIVVEVLKFICCFLAAVTATLETHTEDEKANTVV